MQCGARQRRRISGVRHPENELRAHCEPKVAHVRQNGGEQIASRHCYA
jgi:hypothetical protein